MSHHPRLYRIGIDCGGTNTDAVLLDLTPGATEVVLAASKAPTTLNVTGGIVQATRAVLEGLPHIAPGSIQALAIGTTHFVNALIQRSEESLEPVAVIRLCGPFSRRTPPFAGFPFALKSVVEGGFHMPMAVNPGEIEEICRKIKADHVRCIAITSVFAPIDFEYKHEEQVAEIVRRCIPGAFVTCSNTVANMGLLERENATILNACLLPFASMTVIAFKTAAESLGLACPVFVTSNDGTLLSLPQALSHPIRTFSSGPTNSMRGASFLAKLDRPDAVAKSALVVDIGGTTTEVGMLLPSGFPRQAANRHNLCGVNLNFSMPHITSIGLGGGSLVTEASNGVALGPKSVGYKILEEAKVFGGTILTATDIVVAAGLAPDVGDRSLVDDIAQSTISAVLHCLKAMLEVVIDSMKTSSDDIPVYLVGGGAILAPLSLRGVSEVHRFPYYFCANAVGAAIAQVAGVIDTVQNMEGRSTAEVQRETEQEAIQRAIDNGADPSSVKVIESEALPIAYTANKCRFMAKAAGSWLGVQANANSQSSVSSTKFTVWEKASPKAITGIDLAWNAEDILSYKPRIKNRVWYLSEIDLEFLAIGTYIMGCGGGGSPQHAFLCCRELLRAGDEIRVVDLVDVPRDGLCGWGGGMGSPDVTLERLMCDDYTTALQSLLKFMGIEKISALVAMEIGGGNGMRNFLTGAKSVMDLPVVDGDFMGRAYPTAWQTTPNVYDDTPTHDKILPTLIASGDGSMMIMTMAKNDRTIDSALRSACVEMGTQVGVAHAPLSPDFCQTAMVKNTVSLSWRLGRAVKLSNSQGTIGSIGDILIDALGGKGTGKVLFTGKIVHVIRKVHKGHLFGEVRVEPLGSDETEDISPSSTAWKGSVTIPFKNENLFCEHSHGGKKRILASVPDLISVIDSGNGSALGTPEYKYGQRVTIIGFTAAPQWTGTQRALDIGSAKAFGYENIPYSPLGIFVQPRSVIEQYSVQIS